MIRVLMVDDDLPMLEISKILLEKSEDVEVACLGSAQEALETLKEDGHYDVIVSDYSMPGMDGISFLKRVRVLDQDIPFILFTGKSREEVAIEALNNGADHYLQKDASPKVLYAELTHQILQAAEKERMKRAVLESERRYRSLFESMNEGFVLCELVRDAQNRPVDYVVKDTNSQINLIAGVELQEAIGKRATEIFRSETPPFLEAYANVVETGSPARFEGYLPLINRYFIISAFSIGNGEFATILSDITERRQAELDLHEARDYMESLLHYANAPMVVWSPDLKIVRFNRAFERLTGYAAADLIGEDATALFSGEGRKLLEKTNYAREGEGWEPVEIPVRCRDGGEKIVLWNSAKVRSQTDGSLVATIIQGLDITERKRAEEEVRNSYKMFEDIIEFLPDATFVIDEEGKVIAWNRAVEEMTGISKGKIIGKDGYAHGKVFYGTKRPTLIDFVFSKDEKFEHLYQHVKRKGNTIFGEAIISPPRGTKGAYVWATASPLFDEDGNIMGAIESIRDITEIVETEMTLQESEERMRLIIEAADLGIWDRNLVTGEVVRNKQMVEIFGYPEDELVGLDREREKMIHPDDFGRVVSVLRDHLEKSTPHYEADYRLKRKDGRWIWIHDRGEVADRDEMGHPLRMLGITQDVTQFWQSQEALTEANKKLNLLSSVTRHDILNQIVGLSGCIDLMNEILPEDCTVMQEHIDRAMALTETIHRQVVFTRDYQDMGIEAPQWHSVEEVVRRAVETAPIEIAQNQVRLDISTGSLQIFADPMLEKVFFNLIDNAVRHGNGVSKIAVSFVERRGEGVIAVQDDGSGIPKDMKAQIFDHAFDRQNGYGLFLCREILGITRMTIAETGEDGKGARFEIAVPKENYRWN